VVCWLQARGLEPRPELVKAIFARAKAASSVLGEEEVLAVCAEQGVTVPR
jgi:predicted signal transduction protein with EAL and GGDEF domain